MKKKTLSFILALLMVFSLLPVSALADTTASGTCGNNLTWTLDENGVLTITGTGYMNFRSDGDEVEDIEYAPWQAYKSRIKSVVIGEGGSGGALASTAVQILNAYFTSVDEAKAVVGENMLIQ